MSFKDKFQDYYTFNRSLDRYIRSYFRKLYREQEEVKDFESYPLGKPTTIGAQGSIWFEHHRYDEEEFDEPYLVMVWKGTYADHDVGGSAGVPLSEFITYASQQWGLEEDSHE